MNTAIMLLLKGKRSGCSPVPAHHTVRGIVPLRQSLLGTTDSPALKRGQSSVCNGSLLNNNSSSCRPLSTGVPRLGLGTHCTKARSQDKARKWHSTDKRPSKTPTRACFGARCWAWRKHLQVTRPMMASLPGHTCKNSGLLSFPPCLSLLVSHATKTWLYLDEIDEKYTLSSSI